MALLGIFTNTGVLKAREADNNEGFHIYPTGFGISRTRGTLDPNRDTANAGLWYNGLIASRVAVSNNTVKFICTIPVGVLAPGVTDFVREIYLYGTDTMSSTFIFAIGQTTEDIIYDPSGSVTLELEVSLTNADLSSTLVFQYTQATELSEHETDPNAHAEIIAAMNKAGIFLKTGGVPFSYAGQTFDEKAEFAGTRAVASTGTWVFQAQYNGPAGNGIVLSFNGSQTVDEVILAWNAANPNNPVQLVSGDGSGQPPSQLVSFSGGTLAVGSNRLVYRDTDNLYKQALADGSIKSRVVGLADTTNRIVRSAGFVGYSSGYPVGTELFLSPTLAGQFTNIPSEVKVALVVSPSVILLSSFGGGTAVAGQNFDTIVTDTPGFKKFPTTQQAIAATPDNGFIFVDKMENISFALDLQGKALTFVFNGPKTGWARYTGQVEQIQLAFSAQPTTGTWRIEWDGNESADLPYTADALAVQTAFNAFPGHPGVTVSGNYLAGFLFTFLDNGAYPLPTFLSTGTDEVQTLSFSGVPDDGTIRLNVDGQQTLNIPWNSTAEEVEIWIEQLTNVSDVQVTGSFASQQFTIRFTNTDGKKDWPQITVANSSLAAGVTPITATMATTTQGRYPASNLRAGVTPVAISATLLQAGLPLGPTTLVSIQKDRTRFLGHGVVRDFPTAFDLAGFKEVDIEVVFDGVGLPVANTVGGLKPQTEYHRHKSFGVADRDTLVVGSASNPGEYNSLMAAVAAAQTGNRIVVVEDQSISSAIVIDKDIEIEFVNGARLVVTAPIAGVAVTLSGFVRTRHLHALVAQAGSYGTIVLMDGAGGHHTDVYVECSGSSTLIDRAFAVGATGSAIYCHGLLQIGTATVTTALGNDSGLSHDVVIRDRSNGILHDLFNRRPPVQSVLAGDVDGVNTEFTLPEPPANPQAVLVMVDSVPRFPGVHLDIAGSTVTFRAGNIPEVGQDVWAYYLPAGLLTAPPTAKAGSIEVLSSGGGTVVEALRKLKVGVGMTVTPNPLDPTEAELGFPGAVTDLANIAVDIQPDGAGSHSVGAVARPWKDVFLKDKSTNDVYRLEIDNGILQAVLEV